MHKHGFALIEMIVVMGIITILFALTWPQLFRLRGRNLLQSTATKLISDMRQQQLKAMNSSQMYGVHFEQTKYTQFTGSQYVSSDVNNIVSDLDTSIEFSQIDLPNSTFVFASGSGELIGFDEQQRSVVLEDTIYHESHTIQLNEFGVPVRQ